MERNTKAAKAKLESMLGTVERKVPASRPAAGTCQSTFYCVP